MALSFAAWVSVALTRLTGLLAQRTKDGTGKGTCNLFQFVEIGEKQQKERSAPHGVCVIFSCASLFLKRRNF